MSLVRRSSPFGELLSLRQAMDRLFEDSYVRPRGWSGGGNTDEPQALPLDVSLTNDALVVRAALPGVRPEDVDITVTGDTLTITGSNEEQHEETQSEYLFREVRRGTFSRTLTLPANLRADAATASFENGMLTLTVPKAEEAKPRQIRISATSDGTSARNVGSGGATQQPASRHDTAQAGS